MPDELKDSIVEAGEGLPVGRGDVSRVVAAGKRRLFGRRLSYGALSVAVVGAGWLAGAELLGGDPAPIPPADHPPTSPAPSEARECPHETEGGAVIDWVNFVHLDGIAFHENYYTRKSFRGELLGPVHATVECKVADNVTDPGYEIQDGDAAFLEPGAEIYRVKGYSPSFRLAARWNGELVLYEADTNPEARVGEDLLDIRGKVDYIGVNSPRDGETELGAIRDPEEVARLTEMVLEAPVDQDKNLGGGDNIFAAFHLGDGTVVVRAVSESSAIMSRGIHLPAEFVDALKDAMTRR